MVRAAFGGVILAFLLIFGAATPSRAWDRGGHRHHHHHHHYRGGARLVIGLAPAIAWGYYARPWYAAPPHAYAYPRPYGYRPWRVIRDEPEVWVERPADPEPGYWYYCESAGEYYPRVPDCPEPWVRVEPR